jgi:hypothetical protein
VDEQRVEADAVNRQLDLAGRVEHDHRAGRGLEPGLGLADLEAQRDVAAEALAEDVGERRVEGDRVLRPGAMRSLDRQRVAVHVGAQPGQLRGHADQLLLEGLVVQGVRKAHRPEPAWTAVLAQSATVPGDLERAVGAEGERLGFRREERPLG